MYDGCGVSRRDSEAQAVPQGWKSPGSDGLLPHCERVQRVKCHIATQHIALLRWKWCIRTITNDCIEVCVCV